MRLLLDTHTFLWYITDDGKLSRHAEAAISDGSNDVLLGIGCLWEIAIENGLGKLSLARPFGQLMPNQLSRNRIDVLSIELSHFAAYNALPLHHRDPFDRLLIAQAQTERIPVVGKDLAFDEYDIEVWW